MYAVIFRAKLRKLDEPEYKRYADTAQRMRQLALEQYGCVDFTSVCEGEQEIAISYWPDEAAIHAWKQDQEHRAAQTLGRDHWYSEYTVEVAHVERSYRFGGSQ